MQNEHIEYFKRFAASYLRWSHFNMDRIVSDVIRKDAEAEIKRKEQIRNKILMDNIPTYEPTEDFNFNFERDVKFGKMLLRPEWAI